MTEEQKQQLMERLFNNNQNSSQYQPDNVGYFEREMPG